MPFARCAFQWTYKMVPTAQCAAASRQHAWFGTSQMMSQWTSLFKCMRLTALNWFHQWLHSHLLKSLRQLRERINSTWQGVIPQTLFCRQPLFTALQLKLKSKAAIKDMYMCPWLMWFTLFLTYIFSKTNFTNRSIIFYLKVCNNPTLRSQFIRSSLTVADNFIVTSVVAIKAFQATKSITSKLFMSHI